MKPSNPKKAKANMQNIEIDKVAFEGPNSGPYKGFTLKATYLKAPKGDALDGGLGW